MSHPSPNPKAGKFLLVFLALILFTSVFIAVADRIPSPPRLPFMAFFYEGNLVLHLLLGLGSIVLLLWLGPKWRMAIKETPGAGKLFGALAALGLFICLAAGIGLLIFGNLRPQANILLAHGLGALVAAVAAAVWLMARASSTSAGAAPDAERRAPSAQYRPAAALICLSVLPGFLLMWGASKMVDAEARINNDKIAPLSPDGEGDGPKGKFFPSSVQSVDDKFFPPEYFTDNKSCGEVGCHPDIYKQWDSSAHHNGSFNNQWYRRSIEYMQEVVGTKPSKWCGGCHDMAILLTEKPGTGKSRFDFPIKDQIYPSEEHVEAHSGIGCAACHSTVHVKSSMGNGDYLADYPPMHQFVISKNPFLKATTKFLTRLAPSPHRKTFLKPFHKVDTAKFCSSCHKVHLDVPVNNFRWFRGFNDYDAWQASGVSGFGARSFYYPNKDGKPDFKKCADCHMPWTPSGDAGNNGGKVHSHRFPAANTALPYVNHDTEQLTLTQKFLKDGALSIDIFALRREKAEREKGYPHEMGTGRAGERENRPNAKRQAPSANPEGQAASLFGEAATTGQAGPLMPAKQGEVNETVIAPLDRGAVAVQRGKDALIDVVIRTRKVGHAFPGGTFDAFDVWAELQAKDEKGKVLFWSGSLQWPDGPVEKSAHQYRALLVDEHSNEINKRNAWSARARIYARAIPPGAADTIHYRLHIPKDCGKKITLTAKLNYRKFSWFNTQFAFGGRPDNGDPNYSKKGFIDGTGLGTKAKSGPVTLDYDDRPMKFDNDLRVVAAKEKEIPKLPITMLCENTVTLDAIDGDPDKATAPRTLNVKKDRERWNDYGIGLMLQGDFARGTNAFKQVTKVAPGWPEGYVNIGRVRQLEGDLNEAQQVFEKALALYETKPCPVPDAMMPYMRARTRFFYGGVLKNRGQYDKALAVWKQAAAVFPDDRELRNQMGRVFFLSTKFDDATKEFEHVLTIDPEDLTAHYNLMLCYGGLGPKYAEQQKRHTALYYRFKNDETKTHLSGPYKIKHPEDNNESIQIHEHGTAPPPGRAPEIVRTAAPKKTAAKSINKS